MQFCTPEQAGISSAHILNFYRELEAYHLSTHAVILERGDKIFSECYYAPFDKDFKHRMYSCSKSFVSVAIGFCEQDGLLSLDDPMAKYFPEYLAAQGAHTPISTVREMLQMQTTQEHGVNWFRQRPEDRTAVYFQTEQQKYPGTLFKYDSSGSYMLGVIVEKLTGKPFLEYLKDKVLREIGFSEDAYCIGVPGGHSFGDSGVMCTARDLLRFARFVLNGGTYNGKRYLNKEYLDAATDLCVCNYDYGFANHATYGYGYQFWGAPRGCFAMFGMGNQIACCDPVHDFIFIINSDNQGNDHNYEQIFEALTRNILDRFDDSRVLVSDLASQTALAEHTATRKLYFLPGRRHSDFADKITGRIFISDENPMGIKWFRLDFAGDRGRFTYENAQGEKCFDFGFGHNVFGKFPEEGYSDLVATVPAPGNRYDAAFSADWAEEKKLRIRVQIIDKYFGNLAIVFGFRDADTVSVRMTKKAEAFLEEYSGVMSATAK